MRNSAATGIQADQKSLVRIGGRVESSKVCWSMRRNRQAIGNAGLGHVRKDLADRVVAVRLY
jgi:hypothetical protein